MYATNAVITCKVVLADMPRGLYLPQVHTRALFSPANLQHCTLNLDTFEFCPVAGPAGLDLQTQLMADLAPYATNTPAHHDANIARLSSLWRGTFLNDTHRSMPDKL
jgi:hypothetical protein